MTALLYIIKKPYIQDLFYIYIYIITYYVLYLIINIILMFSLLFLYINCKEYKYNKF